MKEQKAIWIKNGEIKDLEHYLSIGWTVFSVTPEPVSQAGNSSFSMRGGMLVIIEREKIS